MSARTRVRMVAVVVVVAFLALGGVAADAAPRAEYAAQYAAAQSTAGQPCRERVDFAGVAQWAAPHGCYARIYYPDHSLCPGCRAAGFCNWWVELLHPGHHDILDSPKYERGHVAHPGDAVYVWGDEQGASGIGHFVQVVALPDGASATSGWMLITEMNFSWRGGGFWRADYRYMRITPRMQFIYTGDGPAPLDGAGPGDGGGGEAQQAPPEPRQAQIETPDEAGRHLASTLHWGTRRHWSPGALALAQDRALDDGQLRAGWLVALSLLSGALASLMGLIVALGRHAAKRRGEAWWV